MEPSVGSDATLWMTTSGAICNCRLPAIAWTHGTIYLGRSQGAHHAGPGVSGREIRRLGLGPQQYKLDSRHPANRMLIRTGCRVSEPARHRKPTPKTRSGLSHLRCGATLNSLRQRGRPPAGHWFPNRWRPATDLAFRGRMLGQASPLRMRRFLERPAASGMC